MAISLYLLRHAIAVERGTPGFVDDRLRPLSDTGRAKMERIAAGLRALELKFDVILTSPCVRARETAEIAAAALGQKGRLRLEPALRTDRSPQEFLARFADKYADKDRVLAVGHEPFLSSLATLLLGMPGHSVLIMKKGALCKLNISRLKPRPVAQLEWLLTPRQLRMLK